MFHQLYQKSHGTEVPVFKTTPSWFLISSKRYSIMPSCLQEVSKMRIEHGKGRIRYLASDYAQLNADVAIATYSKLSKSEYNKLDPLINNITQLRGVGTKTAIEILAAIGRNIYLAERRLQQKPNSDIHRIR